MATQQKQPAETKQQPKPLGTITSEFQLRQTGLPLTTNLLIKSN